MLSTGDDLKVVFGKVCDVPHSKEITWPIQLDCCRTLNAIGRKIVFSLKFRVARNNPIVGRD
jgi:hypothetical protein